MDDGAQFIEESVKMARIAEEDGVRKIISTPHLFKGDYGPRSFAELDEKRNKLREALRREGIEVELFPGAEVHITSDLLNEVQRNREHLVMNRGSYMLVEFPSDHVYARTKDLFFELMSSQITPIIAHPERNYVFTEHPDMLYELILMGAYGQANNGSFIGLYGRKVQEAAYRFLRWNFIHFVGSDGHNTFTLSPKLSDAYQRISVIHSEKTADCLLKANPNAVLENRQLPYNPEPIYPKEKQRSLKIRLPGIFQKKQKNQKSLS